jgi:transcriptional regulator with XRE-family HTH domain
MHKRVSEVRKAANLTQGEFADKLGLTRNFISLIENGNRDPSDRTIADICREFNVSETWLRTGEGEMTVPRSREEEISEMVGRALSGTNELKKAVIRMICTRTEKELEDLEKMLWEIVNDIEKSRDQTEV